MPVVRRPDGMLAFQTSDGLTVPMGERPLRELGLELPGLDPAATAMNNEGGSGNVPDQRSDVPAEVPGAGGTGNRTQNQGGGVGAANAPEMTPREPPTEPELAKPKEGKSLRGGGTVEEIDVPEGTERAPARQSLQRIPGGDVRTGYSRQVGANPEDIDELRGAIGKAGESERRSVEADAEFEHGMRQKEAQLLGEEIAAQRQSLDATKWKRAQAEEHIRNEQEEINAERAKVESLEQAPHSYWAGQNTFAKIAAFIGAGLGGALQGLKGGDNQFLTRLDRIIADDKAERAAKLQARRRGFTVRQDRLDKFAEKYGPEVADREIEARQRLLVASMMRKHAADTGSQALMMKMGAQADAIEAKAREAMARVDVELGDKIVEQIQNIPDRYVGGGPVAKEGDVHQYGRDLEAAGLGESEGEIGEIRDLIGALPGEDDEELPTIETRNIVSRGIRSAADTVAGRGAGSTVMMDSPEERKAVASVERIKGRIRHKLSGAAVSPQEQAKLEDQLDRINTRGGLTNFVSELERKTERRKAGVRAGIRPEAVQTYEERKRAYDLPSRPKGLQGER